MDVVVVYLFVNTLTKCKETCLFHKGFHVDESCHKIDFKLCTTPETVETKQKLSLEEFYRSFDSKRPVVITGTFKDVTRKWSEDFFLENFGQNSLNVKLGNLEKSEGHQLTIQSFCDNFLHKGTENVWSYAEDEVFLLTTPSLYEDVKDNIYANEDYFKLFPQEIKPWDCMLLWGSKFSRSPLHMDPYNWTGILSVFSGRKFVRLFPPGQDHLLYIKSGQKCGFPLECHKYNSPLDTFNVDVDNYPMFLEARWLEADLTTGDMLIIPTGWYHQAFNFEETMAVSQQIMNRNNYQVILQEIIKAKNLDESLLSSDFSLLEPQKQVQHVISLLPERIFDHGRKINKINHRIVK